MADTFFDRVHKNETHTPDVLSCLANLSNDEVFTSPDVVNKMLDMLPQELFSDPNSTFLDPACKTGVFLREVAKRLLIGLEPVYPDLQERIDHIFHKQLYGIAITELTSLLSRRSVYCSKYPNGKYSITKFDNAEGNIRYRRIKHTWVNGKCKFCGIGQDTKLGDKDRESTLETYAYEWIHVSKPEEILNLKIDVIICNPPYAQDTAGAGRQAKPIYNQFVEQAKKLKPRYISMIIPSRWFSGGMGLDEFRSEMMNDKHITRIVDYTNSKDCFPGNSVSGGVCYFLWEKDRTDDCLFTNITSNEEDTLKRPLNEFSSLVRYNKAIPIIHKVQAKNEEKLDTIISSLMPYGLSTSFRGQKEYQDGLLTLHSSSGISYIDRSEIVKGFETVDSYKILVSKTSAEHAGEPGKDGRFRIIPTSMKILGPSEVCTHSYFIIGNWSDRETAENALTYLKTKFVRFLMLLCVGGFGLSKLVFAFVPNQDFSKPWTDEELYARYELTESEIAFIESMIKPFSPNSEEE